MALSILPRCLVALTTTLIFTAAGCNGGGAENDAGIIDGGIFDSSLDGGVFDASLDADVPDPIVEDVIHVPEAGEFSALGQLSLGSVNIDTSTLQIDGSAVPDDIIFDVHAQEPAGPELAVLHVRSFTVEKGATVTVTGERPLVIISSREVTIDGTLDTSANMGVPGANGGAGGGGEGPGGDGENVSTSFDSGGGGAGHGTRGAQGGFGVYGLGENAVGGAAGIAYSDPQLTTLRGGSSGGNGSPTICLVANGAGGGALQVYSGISITISGTGRVGAGGGGGGGGIPGCPTASSAGGGGSGGAIFLQAPTVTHEGILAANGGGGGGGASPLAVEGTAGGNGVIGLAPAAGGNPGGIFAGNGGDGGAQASSPVIGSDEENGGGGGGAVGRIAVFVNVGQIFTSTGIVSPAAYSTTY